MPGNHDHELIAPALEAARLDVGRAAAARGQFDPATGALPRRVAERIGGAEVVARLPGRVGCATTCTPPTATTSTCT